MGTPCPRHPLAFAKASRPSGSQYKVADAVAAAPFLCFTFARRPGPNGAFGGSGAWVGPHLSYARHRFLAVDAVGAQVPPMYSALKARSEGSELVLRAGEGVRGGLGVE